MRKTKEAPTFNVCVSAVDDHIPCVGKFSRVSRQSESCVDRSAEEIGDAIRHGRRGSLIPAALARITCIAGKQRLESYEETEVLTGEVSFSNGVSYP